MDWNWYFSTLSQSAAGIVGIVGAFIITKILNNQVVFLQKTARTQQLLAESKLKQATANHIKIKWFNYQTAMFQQSEYQNFMDKGMDLNEIYKHSDFSVYMTPDDAKETIKEWVREQVEIRENKNNSSYGTGLYSALSIPTDNQIQSKREHRRNVEAEGDAIDKSYIECRYQTEINNNHYSDLFGNPESSREISITIIFLSLLFLIGVIYPMSFLPASPNGYEFSWKAIPEFYFSLKGALLTAVTILFFAIVRVFYRLNKNLTYSEEEVGKLKRYTVIGTFSPAFVVRDLNELA